MEKKSAITKTPTPSAVATQPQPTAGLLANPKVKRWLPAAIGVGALVILVLIVWGVQAFLNRGRPSPFARSAWRLLDRKPVQDELKLTEDQLAKLMQVYDQHAKAMSFTETGGMTDWDLEKRNESWMKKDEKEIAKILDSAQLKRLKQIHMQQRGGKRAWLDDDVAKALKLSNLQKGQIKEIQAQFQKEQRDAFPRGGNRDANRDEKEKQAAREKMREQMQELTKKYDDDLTNVLTAEQQVKWQDMIGEPFKFETGGGGPRGAAQGGQGQQQQEGQARQGRQGGRRGGRNMGG